MKLKINEIKSNPNNPRLIKNDKFKKLVQSLKDFPIMAKKLRRVVVDENNIILGGNMRFKAIKEAGMKEVHVEYFTREDAEENNRLAKELDPEYVDKTYEEQCREFVIKDNVSGGEWDLDLLANEWDAEELDAWGLDTPDGWGEDTEVEEDEVPEVSSEPPVSKLGEVYQLGRHRVMCADSTVKENVELLMNGEKADMVFTDPPYNFETQGGMTDKFYKKTAEGIKDIVDFKPAEWLKTLPSYFSGTMNTYIFCNKDLVLDYLLFAKENGYSTNILVWKKPNTAPFGDSHRPDIEYLILLRKNAIFNNGLDVSYSRCLEFGKDNSTPHPTMKPLELIATEVRISSNKRGIVVDCFLGSGSTLIACEQTDRTCYGMELDEKYVDVIRKRYHKFVTGSEEGWQDETPAI